MQVIVVLGAWSSGSTALTGYIARLGAWTCPPHVFTFDERTPDSHESRAFRDALATHVDELTLQPLADKDGFARWFSAWLPNEIEKARAAGHGCILLKHPLTAFFVPQLDTVCQPKYLVVTRQYASIERTRIRRRWHAVYGAAGANKVYSALFSALIAGRHSFLSIAFEEFISNPATRAELRRYLDLAPDTNRLAQAERWLR